MTELYFRKWEPRGESIRAAVLLIHGAMEHTGRYEQTANWFNREGIVVCAGDLPGHGNSGGRQGHVNSFAEYEEAIGQFVQRTRRMQPDVPLFLLGHSMGSLAIVRYLQSQTDELPVRGVILCSPCLGLKMPVSVWKLRLAGVLNKLCPGLRLNNEINPSWTSRTPAEIESYANDPLVYKKVSVRWFIELQSAMQQALSESKRFDLPLLLLQAGSDRVVDSACSTALFQQVKSTDKEYHEFPECYHQLLQEPEREEVLRHILKWCEQRI
ncbi:MAG: alpha/beta hydrolase [Bacilli bacterium]|nr:alpha/beta hydrolase [Bacilli bacterium]